MSGWIVWLLPPAAAAVAAGVGAGLARLAQNDDDSAQVVDRVNAVLPQTQCGQCGFGGCRPYATAIANGEAEINRCPPGGERTIVELAALLGRTVIPLSEDLEQAPEQPQVARVIEADCIGCTKCIQACPVDAIVGAAKQMHTVIIEDCTGCKLCVDPCPVDCIVMDALPMALADYRAPLPGTQPTAPPVALRHDT